MTILIFNTINERIKILIYKKTIVKINLIARTKKLIRHGLQYHTYHQFLINLIDSKIKMSKFLSIVRIN